MSQSPWQDVAVLILLPPSEKKNATVKPTPAISVYSGVLYQGLDWSTLTPAARRRAVSSIFIISAKYGAVRPDQLIESYKAKIDNKVMAAPIGKALDSIKTELIIDCRSSTYKTVWRSPVEKTVEVHVSTVVDGVRKVVTHMSKKTRGEIARWLLQSRAVAKTPEDLYAIVSEKYPCALTPSDGTAPWILEVIAV
ncbi:MAG: peroxide stress protein YaaA [Candidatus Planktophila sp.]